MKSNQSLFPFLEVPDNALLATPIWERHHLAAIVAYQLWACWSQLIFCDRVVQIIECNDGQVALTLPVWHRHALDTVSKLQPHPSYP
jgi:hypothetical protein